MKKLAVVAVALLAWAAPWMQCSAQDSAPPPAPAAPLWSSAELDQMLGPIALYPDPLIGIILPAATEPAQIVMADRYLSGGGDPNQIAEQPWDSSVQGLAHYPNVLKWMDDNLEWTTELGQAFLNQQADVMDSIQRLRGQARSLGNLQSTPQENVVIYNGEIDIDPVEPDEIYVPDYQPTIIYYQPGYYCSFGIPFAIGVWLDFDWDWHHHHLICWDRDHPRPRDWWHRPPEERRRELPAHDSNLWRPITRTGSVIVTGGDRGYEARGAPSFHGASKIPVPRSTSRTGPRPALAPRVPVTVISRTPEARQAPEIRRAPEMRQSPAPEVSRPIERSAPSESVFGGSQSSREVRESSSRGEESRGSMSSELSRSGGSSSKH